MKPSLPPTVFSADWDWKNVVRVRNLLSLAVLVLLMLLWPVRRASSTNFWTEPEQIQQLLCTFYIGFNTAADPVDDVLVRKALVASLDRTLLPAVLDEPAVPAMTLTPPGVFGHVNGFVEGVGIAYDPGQAAVWLGAAGFPGGQDFPDFQLHFSTHSDYNPALPQVIQAAWSDHLDISATLYLKEHLTFLADLASDPPQSWLFRRCTDSPDQVDASYFLKETVDDWRLALGNWYNPTYEDLLAQAASSSDPAERQALFRQAEEILVETDVVIFPLYYQGVVTFDDFLPTVFH